MHKIRRHYDRRERRISPNSCIESHKRNYSTNNEPLAAQINVGQIIPWNQFWFECFLALLLREMMNEEANTKSDNNSLSTKNILLLHFSCRLIILWDRFECFVVLRRVAGKIISSRLFTRDWWLVLWKFASSSGSIQSFPQMK